MRSHWAHFTPFSLSTRNLRNQSHYHCLTSLSPSFSSVYDSSGPSSPTYIAISGAPHTSLRLPPRPIYTPALVATSTRPSPTFFPPSLPRRALPGLCSRASLDRLIASLSLGGTEPVPHPPVRLSPHHRVLPRLSHRLPVHLPNLLTPPTHQQTPTPDTREGMPPSPAASDPILHIPGKGTHHFR